MLTAKCQDHRTSVCDSLGALHVHVSTSPQPRILLPRYFRVVKMANLNSLNNQKYPTVSYHSNNINASIEQETPSNDKADADQYVDRPDSLGGNYQDQSYVKEPFNTYARRSVAEQSLADNRTSHLCESEPTPYLQTHTHSTGSSRQPLSYTSQSLSTHDKFSGYGQQSKNPPVFPSQAPQEQFYAAKKENSSTTRSSFSGWVRRGEEGKKFWVPGRVCALPLIHRTSVVLIPNTEGFPSRPFGANWRWGANKPGCIQVK
jgi:hypothetical protein